MASLIYMESEEEEVFRDRMEELLRGYPTGWQWMNRKSSKKETLGRGNLLSWGEPILPLWPKWTQRQAAAAADSRGPKVWQKD